MDPVDPPPQGRGQERSRGQGARRVSHALSGARGRLASRRSARRSSLERSALEHRRARAQQLLDRRRQRSAAGVRQRQPEQSRLLGASRPVAHRARQRLERQPEVGEAVLDRRQRGAGHNVGGKARAAMRGRVGACRRAPADSTDPPRCRRSAGARAALRRAVRAAARWSRAAAAFFLRAGPAARRSDARGGRRNRRRPGRHRSAAGCAGTRWRPGPSGPACRFRYRAPATAPRRAPRARARRPDRRRRRRCRAWRASTRFTLPSRIAPRAPNAKAAIAAAVERPMPGSAAIAAASRGKTPPCSATIACAARCSICARR